MISVDIDHLLPTVVWLSSKLRAANLHGPDGLVFRQAVVPIANNCCENDTSCADDWVNGYVQYVRLSYCKSA